MHDASELALLVWSAYQLHLRDSSDALGRVFVREGTVKGGLAQERTGSVGIAGNLFQQAG